jgi:hypothetical protein
MSFFLSQRSQDPVRTKVVALLSWVYALTFAVLVGCLPWDVAGQGVRESVRCVRHPQDASASEGEDLLDGQG